MQEKTMPYTRCVRLSKTTYVPYTRHKKSEDKVGKLTMSVTPPPWARD